ncbi:MAG TPA: tetratricopeptide repeat protein [Polyangiaceae bacterium]|nr:tetratricopeptide repeat protein [Polyangiaceae bacterium]
MSSEPTFDSRSDAVTGSGREFREALGNLKRRLRLALVPLLLAACAPKLPPAYVQARDAAESAYAHGQFIEAAERWLSAADRADTARDRSDARYRAAAAYERAGRVEDARKWYAVLASGKSERAPRATFALADLRLKGGDTAGGLAELEAAIRKYPTSAIAALALRRYFAALADQGGDRAVLDYIQRVEPELGQSELAEQLSYERARRLEALGSTADAARAYVAVADRFPYPYGAYWDDALLRGADCELRLGKPENAIELLERMLHARETSRMSGSYERPHFADAAYRLAELYRDARHDPATARRAFRSVFIEYPTSTLRDDALWQEALLARRASEQQACEPLLLLVGQLPESRYAPCAHEMCAEIQPGARRCADYIERDLRERTAAKPESDGSE